METQGLGAWGVDFFRVPCSDYVNLRFMVWGSRIPWQVLGAGFYNFGFLPCHVLCFASFAVGRNCWTTRFQTATRPFGV